MGSVVFFFKDIIKGKGYQGASQVASWICLIGSSRQQRKMPRSRPCVAYMVSLFARRTDLLITDQLTLRWSLSLKDLTERLDGWEEDRQDFNFIVEHCARRRLIVPETLRSDAVPKPLCQHCYSALHSQAVKKTGNVNIVVMRNVFTRFVGAFPITNENGRNHCKGLSRWVDFSI